MAYVVEDLVTTTLDSLRAVRTFTKGSQVFQNIHP